MSPHYIHAKNIKYKKQIILFRFLNRTVPKSSQKSQEDKLKNSILIHYYFPTGHPADQLGPSQLN
jgi:hypothetical protein